jgi:hypothetical protein
MSNWRRTAVLLAISCLVLSGVCLAGAPKPPLNPTGTTATAISSTQIDVTWLDNANNETGFRIERKIGVSGTFEELDTVGPNVEYYPDTSCDPDTEYCYQIIAYNVYGDSSPSPTDCETTPGGSVQPPAAPSGLTATTVSSTTIDLDWTDNATNEDGFLIQRKVGVGGTFANLDTVGANQTSYGDDTCDAETTYCYQVRAYNTAGDSAWSNEACDTTPAAPSPPAAPTGLTAAAVDHDTIDLDWTDNATNEDGFLIQRKLGVGGTFGNLDTVGANQTSYSDNSCDPETAYCYQVRAYNTAGDSAWSNEACDTTLSGSTIGHGTYLYHDGQYTQYATGQAAYDAAVAGDEIVFGPGVYAQTIRADKTGTAANPITIRGEGKPRPVIDGATIDKNDMPGKKSPMYILGDYHVVENLEICHTGQDYGHFTNTSGIYYQSGTGLVVRDCFIHNCAHGMYAAAESEEWTLEFNEFCYNGYEGEGYYHNVYNYGWGTNVAQYNVFHHSCALGFKNRSQDVHFLYNTVFYNGLYEVDFMLGESAYGPQDALMVGNWIVKNPNAANYTIFVGFSPRQGGTLTAINNYFQANNPNNTFINIGDESCVAYNNIFDNNGYSGLEVFFNNSGTSSGTNNWISSAATSTGGLSNSVLGTDPGVTDRLDMDFHLTAGSQCIDAGTNSASPLPDKEPVYPMAWVSRPVDSTIDIGPYEYASYTPVVPLPAEDLTAATQSSSSILLEWSNLSTVEDGFIIMRLSDWTVGWEEVDYAAAAATSYLDSGLDSSTTYVYRVIAYNSYGDGACSNDAEATTN